MEIHTWNQLDTTQQTELLVRAPETVSPPISQSVAAILDDIRQRGDVALREYAVKLDGFSSGTPIQASPHQLRRAIQQVSPEVRDAVSTAYQRLTRFHQLGKPCDFQLDSDPRMVCGVKYVPINRVGLYVPGGSTPLISTALMLGVPAQIAGCPNVCMCTTPGPTGELDPATVMAADLCGIDTIYQVGGAHAVAAMAYGTDSITACDKIYGPGGVWVTEAKRQVQSGSVPVTIDMPAGPSEVLVIADETADSEFVACDLLAQSEHGPDSQSVLVTTSRSLAEEVIGAIARHLPELSRQSMIQQSLAFARVIIADSLHQAAAISNRYAPEHLIIQTADDESTLDMITAAGSIFLGAWTPEVLGDYCSGTNHVLPTGGFARSVSGLSVTDFMNRITVQRADADGLRELAGTAEVLAGCEGLDAHARAVAIRRRACESQPAG